MWRRAAGIGLLAVSTGCAAVHVPLYIPRRGGEVRRYYADHGKALQAVEAALKDLGWAVRDRVAPSVYEVDPERDAAERRVLLITEAHRYAGFPSRYGRLNVYVRSSGGVTEVEVRAVGVTALPGRDVTHYGLRGIVRRFWRGLAPRLPEVL